jgi:membrane protein DedA with SNARE-associated domain/membrane-associated phospholipid phosphatase
MKDVFFSLLRQYGGFALFFSHFLEYLGFPLPGETMMLLAGFAAASWFSVIFITLLGSAGTFFGSLLAYLIGRRFGEQVVLKLGRPFHITRGSLTKANAALTRHKTLYIVFSRFIPGVRHAVPYLAGIIKLRRRDFVLANAVSSVVWCAFFVAAGKLLGRKWVLLERLANAYSAAALLILVFIYVVFQYGGRYRRTIYGVALPLIAFAAISLLQRGRSFHLFDTAIDHLIGGLTFLAPVFGVVAELDSLGALTFIAFACAILLYKSRRFSLYGKLIAVNFTACYLLGEAANLLFHRPRPLSAGFFTIVRYTFPSVNSMLSVSFYGFLLYLIHKNVKGPRKVAAGVLLVLMIALSGAARISMHQYYASDVLAGLAAGVSWVVIFVAAVKALKLPITASKTE